jgi:hypothetical protein
MLILADVAADSALVRSLTAGQVDELLLAPVGNGLYRVGEGELYLQFDGKRIVVASQATMKSVTGNFEVARLTETKGYRFCSSRLKHGRGAFVYVADASRQEDYSALDMARDLTDVVWAFISDTERARCGALVAALDVGHDGVSIEAVIETRGAQKSATGEPTLLKNLPMPGCGFVTGRFGSFADVTSWLRRGMGGEGREVADEYDTKVRQASKELGFDFEKDFLANLGQEWALLRNRDGEWALCFTVKDAAAFKKHATRLAEFSNEPWHAEKVSGKDVFRTRAYTMPLVLEVGASSAMVVTSEEYYKTLSASPNKKAMLCMRTPPLEIKPSPGESLFMAGAWFINRDRAMLEQIDVWPGIQDILEPLRAGAMAWGRADEGAGYRRIHIGTSGINRTELQGLGEPILDRLARMAE